MPRVVILCFCLQLSLAPLVHCETAGLSPQMALGLRSVQDVSLSPNGLHIVYRVNRPPYNSDTRSGEVGELWRIAAAGGEPQVLKDCGLNAYNPRWSPDGRWLAWIAENKPGSAPQIYLRSWPDGESHRLTDNESGVAEFKWSPDGVRIGFTAIDVDTEEQKRAQEDGRDWIVVGSREKQRRLYTINIATRETKLVTKADLSVNSFDWSPDGALFAIIAASGASPDDAAVDSRPYIVSAAGGTPRALLEQPGPLGPAKDVTWTRDGKKVAWLASTDISDPYAGSVFTIAATGGEASNLLVNCACTATWLGPLPHETNKHAVLIEERQTKTVRTIDLATGALETITAPGGVIAWGQPSFNSDGMSFALVANSPSHPNEVYFGKTDDPKALRRITESNPSLSDVVLGVQTVTRWRSKDGLEVDGILISPIDYRPGKRYPAVVHVHGGSEDVVTNGWHGDYRDWGQLLAGRGYVVIYPNYRGSRGRGSDFVRGNRHDLMGRSWEDIESALDHVIELGIADAERAGIYGFSWGGYAAGWGATFGSHRFKAAVGGAGIYNWISEAGTNDTRMHEQLAHWNSPLYEDYLLYLERSPIFHINKANTPFLMLHGERDEACPITQAIEMYTAMKWKGTPVELVIYPREGHGMNELAHRRDYLLRGLNWFDRHLK